MEPLDVGTLDERQVRAALAAVLALHERVEVDLVTSTPWQWGGARPETVVLSTYAICKDCTAQREDVGGEMLWPCATVEAVAQAVTTVGVLAAGSAHGISSAGRSGSPDV